MASLQPFVLVPTVYFSLNNFSHSLVFAEVFIASQKSLPILTLLQVLTFV